MTKTYFIDGMTCDGCVAALSRALADAAPQLKTTVSLDAGGTVIVDGEHDSASIENAVDDAGFEIRVD